jgi:hypothetical protein
MMLSRRIPRQLGGSVRFQSFRSSTQKTPRSKSPRALHFRHVGLVPHRGPSNAVVYARDMVFKTIQQMYRACW